MPPPMPKPRMWKILLAGKSSERPRSFTRDCRSPLLLRVTIVSGRRGSSATNLSPGYFFSANAFPQPQM